MGELDRLKNRAPLDPRLKVLGYRFAIQEMKGVHPYLQEYQGQILRGQAVAKACIGLKAKGFTPGKKARYPQEFQGKIHQIHEGIDTGAVFPNPETRRVLEFINGTRVSPDDELITYVARNLEPYRGFHIFLRSLPAILRQRPHARVLIVGGDEPGYGARPPKGHTYRQRYCAELGERVDWSRVHFMGRIPYQTYLRVLQVSACHVYLTYPFVLSWSLTEAMATGCRIVASRTPPVEEVLTDGVNARLFDFFDTEELAQKVCRSLAETQTSSALAARARADLIEQYDLKTRCLPAWLTLVMG